MSWLSPEEWQAVALSLRVAALATALTLPLALGTALLITRTRFPGRSLLNALIHLPLILPPVVTGYLLLLAFGRNGPLGAALYDLFGVTLAFRWTGAVLAAAIMAFPLIHRALVIGLQSADARLPQAAQTLGASKIGAFATITLPLMIPALITGAVLGFAKAMGEFGATITFVANIPGQTQTLPSAIYAFLQVPGAEGSALRLVAVSIAVALGALALSEWLTRRATARLEGRT